MQLEPPRVEMWLTLPSFQALMTGMIDYAGLFPPAELELAEALERYLAHVSGPDGWMLARFVIPTSRLKELSPLLESSARTDERVPVAVLGRGNGSRAGRAAAIASDIVDIENCLRLHSGRVEIEQLEIRLPEDPRDIPFAVGDALEQLTSLPDVIAYFEPSLLGSWRSGLSRTVGALTRAAAKGRRVGLKIRCGGLVASAVPSPVAVAAALSSCRRAGIPVKATQGLHHPVRHFDRDLEATVHGFFNLFIAGALGHVHALAEERLLAILVEEDTAAFRFATDSASWDGLDATTADITAARQTAVTSFGSCSFSEPRADLRQLGLLEDELPAKS